MAQDSHEPTAELADNENHVSRVIQRFEKAADHAESLGDGTLVNLDSRDLVDLRTAAKELEVAIESARKDALDSEIKDRVEPGERLHGLKHVKSHNKVLAEDPGTVIMRAVSQGISYTEFVDVNASALAETAPDLAEIEEVEYTYLL